MGWGGHGTRTRGAGQAARGMGRRQTSPKCPWHKTCPLLAAQRGQEVVTAHRGTKVLTPFQMGEVSPSHSLLLQPDQFALEEST